MAAIKTKSTATKQPNINPHESLSGLARFFADGLKTQTIDQGIKQVPTEFWREITGAHEKTTPRSGDLAPNEVLNLSKLRNREDVKERRENLNKLPGIDYRQEIVHGSERQQSRQSAELDQKIQEIMSELKRLVGSTKLLSNEYAELAVEQKPVASGTYHLNFFDFLFSVIKTARMKVEDSGAWIAVAKKKSGYQQKAKTLGTKFSLSHERTVATQTG